MRDSLLHWRPSPVLPDDVIFQILLRLPVRSLLKLKRVCKSWKTLISDPCFAKCHLQSLTMNPSISHQHLFSSKRLLLNHDHIVSLPVESLFENLSQPTKSVSFRMKRFFRNLLSSNNGSFKDSLKPTKAVEFDLDHSFTIFGSCNGLLCLFDRDHGCFRLWNPLIRLISKKSPTLGCYEYTTYGGFGYDHVSDKYKVLVGFNIFTNGIRKSMTKIYTFGENSLKTIPNFPFPDIWWDGKFVSGTLNWVMLKMGVSSSQNAIISFDLEKENYKELLLPEHDGINVSIPTLCVSDNRLYVCFDENKTHLALWLMKTYGVAESWTKLMMIPHEDPVHHLLQLNEPVLIFEDRIVLIRTEEKFVLYNFNNGRVDSPWISSDNYLYKQHVYNESLVSPLL
ncbi:putative F-box domain-containing protein [Medicago truncatula]|uniref:F-box protein interaction domain protein n=1 Tax=Medicago truncatula TaxID=3880 RepID=A0A072VHY3_MEDTR|nr:F-box/kelch-repeat protein At3g23880 [Medicago truncatula]KEH37755.1 F-box protein interaction domain protein [Medicago truncatula]RHN73845.1 putative F-box domain-containing protein [Medicago truncatula]